MMEGWRSVSARRPCPICGRPNHDHTSRWCAVATDGGAAICHFVSEGAKSQTEQGGYIHVLIGSPLPIRPVTPKMERVRPESPLDWESLVAKYCEAVAPKKLDNLSAMLGVSALSLDFLDIGYIGNGWWSFPMFNADRKPVGIRTRNETGQKRAIEGTHEGVFIPRRRRDGTVLICEGPTCTASMLDLGFDVLGRPSCWGCEDYLSALTRGREVVIIADNDAPESQAAKGTQRLIDKLRRSCRYLKRIAPPYLKDAREWVKQGCTRECVETLAAAARCL